MTYDKIMADDQEDYDFGLLRQGWIDAEVLTERERLLEENIPPCGYQEEAWDRFKGREDD